MYVDIMPTSNHRSLAGLQKYYIIMNVLVLCYMDFIIATCYEDCSIQLKCRTHLNS